MRAAVSKLGITTRLRFRSATGSSPRRTCRRKSEAASRASGNDGDLARAVRRGTQDSINRAGEQIVSRELNVRPTLIIRPGFSVRILVTRDLVLGAE
ncbi:MAG: TrbI/VirB10 family protein [Sphingomonadaceae bacterium]